MQLRDEQATPSTSSTPQDSSVFTTRQSLNRSMIRAEHLPKSSRKKTAVLSNLAKKYELRINLNGNKRGRKAKMMTQEQEHWLFEVLERSDMTYMNPGRKDHVYTGKDKWRKGL